MICKEKSAFMSSAACKAKGISGGGNKAFITKTVETH